MAALDWFLISLWALAFDVFVMKLLVVCAWLEKDLLLQDAKTKYDFCLRLLFWIAPASWIIFSAAAVAKFFKSLPPI